MYVKCSIFKNNIAFRTLRSQTFQWEKKETPSSQNRDPNNQLVKLKLAVLEIQMSPSSPASWGALQGSVKSARPEHIEKCQQRCRSSVTKSPVYRRARPSRRAFVENRPSNARIFVILSSFCDLVHFQSVVHLFTKWLNNALSVPIITNRWAKSQKYRLYAGDFPQTPVETGGLV